MLKKFVPLLILLLAAALNTLSLARYERFHPDEAFFMTFARNAAVNGDWWLQGSLDKPPLTMYLNAVSLKFLAVDTDANGIFQLDIYQGEFAGRAPGVFFGVLLVAVMMALAKALYRDNRAAWIAGLLAALSPYMTAFAPTAFTDMPMLLLAVASLYAAVRRKSAWSGVWFILAFACKPQAVYVLPLLIAFSSTKGITQRRDDAETQRKTVLTFLRESSVLSVSLWFTVVIAIGGVLLFAWDAARPGDSVFALGAVNNAPETLFAAPELWLSRLSLWLSYGQYLAGNAITTGLFLAVAILGVRRNPYTVILWLWLTGYTLFHIVSDINVYDRYLLPALPVFVLLVAKAISTTEAQRFHREKLSFSVSLPLRVSVLNLFFASLRLRAFALCFSVFLALCLCVSVLIFSSVPIGSDRGDYRGIDALANYLNAKPVATVIYDRWLGWELGYYMGQWTDKRRVYFPTPDALMAGAAALDEPGTRYLVAPDDIDVTDWLSALESAHFTVKLETQITRFRVYAVIPRS